MCDDLIHVRDCGGLHRRDFLKATGAAAVLGLAGGGLFTGVARADALTKAQRDEMTPEQIIEVMKKGN
jgi:carbonic anhydrase